MTDHTDIEHQLRAAAQQRAAEEPPRRPRSPLPFFAAGLLGIVGTVLIISAWPSRAQPTLAVEPATTVAAQVGAASTLQSWLAMTPDRQDDLCGYVRTLGADGMAEKMAEVAKRYFMTEDKDEVAATLLELCKLVA